MFKYEVFFLIKCECEQTAKYAAVKMNVVNVMSAIEDI